MRKSAAVPLTLLATVAGISIGAGSYTGCQDRPRHCVDAQNHLVPDASCQTNSSFGYHYVYGGSSGGNYGDVVVGASVSRGGFGGFGGDGGE
jgi:hypothetical protein